jgi:hypothetical protein
MEAAHPLEPLCKRYATLTPFRLVERRLRQSDAPIARFVREVERRAQWGPPELTEFFGVGSARAVRRGDVSDRVADYAEFLRREGLRDDPEDRICAADLIHDLIGHIVFGNGTGPVGEIQATAAVFGFCPAVGVDYFINALLMFALGYSIFVGTTPHRMEVGDELSERVASLFAAGAVLHDRMGAPLVERAAQREQMLGWILVNWDDLRRAGEAL